MCTAHVAILQMASNVCGEVDEVREENADPPHGTSTIHAALKEMQQQSTAHAAGAIVVIAQLQ